MASVRRPSPQTVAVLTELSARSAEWVHGYDLCRALGLKPGTVYPILMRLADRGLVESAWEQGGVRGRPPRHLYRLTAGGAGFLAGHRTTHVEASERAGERGIISARPATGVAGP